MTDEKYGGLISDRVSIVDQRTKDYVGRNLKPWRYVELTEAEWFAALENGYAILVGEMKPTPDGSYTHKKEYWVSTSHVFTDADRIKGVEFDKDTGEDVNPDGVEPWTRPGQLSKLFPGLLDEAYAVSESVNSMLKEPPHRRNRVCFKFDEPITCPIHYKQIIETLSDRYPIISTEKRSPTQPVFGNAREGFNKVYVNGKVLKLSDYPFIEDETKPTEKPKQSHKPASDQKISLRDYLTKHGIQFTAADAKATEYPEAVFVECPGKSKHTNPTAADATMIYNDAKNGFTFKCVHKSCGMGGWQDYRVAVNLPEPKKYGGARNGAGRKTNAEKSKSAKPIETGRPVVFLNRIEETGENAVYSDRPRYEVADEVAKVIFDGERCNNFYRRALEVGSLRRDGDMLKFYPYTQSGVAGVISRVVSLQKYAEGAIVEIANPTKWIAEDIFENQDIFKLPAIRIILSHPYWGGEKIGMITDDGFNNELGTYLDLKADELDLDLDKHSAADDVDLWREWLSDFPFTDQADFENALAYLLTLIVRPGMPVGEVSPMFLITAPREGVGKTLLVDVLTAAVTGMPTHTRTLSDSQTEIKKEIGAALRGAPEVLVFDNVDPKKRLDSAVLASVVTQVRGAFRVLGASEEMTYENRVTTCYTGSNIELTPELAKRSVAIRLSDTGIPEKDRKVKVKNILAETLKQHSLFVSSLIRMVARWIDADNVLVEPKHRMREWSITIEAILKANGIGEHFLGNTDDLMLQTGDEFTVWTNAYKAIVDVLGEKAYEGWTTSEVFSILSFEDNVYSPDDHEDMKGYTEKGKGLNILGEYLYGPKQQSRSIALGKLLRSKVGAVYGGLKLVDTHKTESKNKSKIYRLEKFDQSDSDKELPF